MAGENRAEGELADGGGGGGSAEERAEGKHCGREANLRGIGRGGRRGEGGMNGDSEAQVWIEARRLGFSAVPGGSVVIGSRVL